MKKSLVRLVIIVAACAGLAVVYGHLRAQHNGLTIVQMTKSGKWLAPVTVGCGADPSIVSYEVPASVRPNEQTNQALDKRPDLALAPGLIERTTLCRSWQRTALVEAIVIVLIAGALIMVNERRQPA